jgi:hypothetical protein
MQQRGIPPGVVECLFELGETARDYHGGTIYFFSRAALRQPKSPALQRILEQGRKVYAVVSQDQVVVTVGHRTKRIHGAG